MPPRISRADTRFFSNDAEFQCGIAMNNIPYIKIKLPEKCNKIFNNEWVIPAMDEILI
jgi:hypothetical protein